MRRLRIAAALVCAFALGPVAHASAAPGDPFQYQFSSTSEGLPVPLTEPTALATDHESGAIYVLDQSRVDRFGPDGRPADFSALGSPQIEIGQGQDIDVDNSGTASQGNIYVFNFGQLSSFRSDGTPIGTNPKELIGVNGPCGVGVDAQGQLWAVTQPFSGGVPEAVAITPEGLPTGERFPLPSEPGPRGNDCQPTFDRNGYLTVLTEGPPPTFTAGGARYDSNHEFALVTSYPLRLYYRRELQVDPSTGDAYESSAVEGGETSPGARESVIYSYPFDEPTKPIDVLPGIEYAEGLAFDGSGQTLYVTGKKRIDVFHREPVAPPRDLAPLRIEAVRSTGVSFSSSLIANGAPSSFSLEYGTTPALGQTSPPIAAPYDYFPVSIGGALTGLAPNTTYYVRLAATNAAGTTRGEEFVFKTFAGPGDGSDPCPNALARKQTGANTLPECRAYELVSAADTGGYDVESSLGPGQMPFPGYPGAVDRVLYATHSGAVPGPWNPTNKGPDPYLATRGPEGWSTTYEGLPADLDPRAGSFSSVLGEASADLGALAFAGPGLCEPCFGSGLATGIPVRRPDGALVQGMGGSLAGSVPASAKPEGSVARYLSADGHYLVFASRYAFEPGANAGGLTVYERDLAAGTTQIVSTDPGGAALTGPGISELGLADDGSRVLSAKGVAIDADGNEYVHPYLHLAGRAASVDLAPGTTSGVLFAGMTSDGSRVFFTTRDRLVPADTDNSADLYEAAVDAGGSLALSVVGGANGDACEPVANSAGPHWNTVGSEANCDTVAIAGGGGVAAGSGAVYFLSPLQLAGGAGVAEEPNLYRATPGGAPTFVATLEPDNPLVVDSVKAAATRQTGDFETTRDGRFAAFRSALPIGGGRTGGFLDVFRYDAAGGGPECVSCDRTGSDDDAVSAEATLAPAGLSLTESGTVFFTTAAQLQLIDANGRRDVYVSGGGEPHLISAGSGPFDSALLSASANGTDAFFFTRDDLARGEDRNGALVRIYDARVGGGFFKLPASVPCQAADECHGPGSVAPGPADIKTSGKTTRGNHLVCGKHRVKRGGRCVKKKHARKRRHHRHAKHGRHHKHRAHRHHA